ncbi:MAG: 6-phosphogluconolactonase [Acidobacteriota bacterium]|nr:MAG: 6-phosphogluconolactonase [Acidobacteriota bacterium]
MSKPRVIACADRQTVARRARELVSAQIVATVSRRHVFHLALAGGSTPQPLYERLAADPWCVPWPAVRFYFGDERCVSPDDPESNYRMARETLLDRLPIAGEQIERMRAEDRDRERAAADYVRKLPLKLDLVLLGLGTDGHTASLFPDSPAVRDQQRRVVVTTGPKPPHERLTITPPVLRDADELLVLVTGAEKANVLKQVLLGDWNPHVLPAQLARRGTWIIDREAAGELPSGGFEED